MIVQVINSTSACRSHLRSVAAVIRARTDTALIATRSALFPTGRCARNPGWFN
jgi:hypothetical protein